MSTAAAKPDGYVVITEVGFQGYEVASSKTQRKTDPQQNFFKGEPLALGVTQILCGLFQIFFGIVIDIHSVAQASSKFFLFLSGVPFWSGILYIICGSFSVAAARNPRIGLVRASLVMNIITAVASAVAIIIYIMHVSIFEISNYAYYSCGFSDSELCRLVEQARTISYAIFFLLLILSILGFCISISTSAFGCKTLCRTAYNEVSMVIYKTTSPQPAQPTVGAVPPSLTDAHEILPLFKEFENP